MEEAAQTKPSETSSTDAEDGDIGEVLDALADFTAGVVAFGVAISVLGIFMFPRIGNIPQLGELKDWVKRIG